MELQAAKSVGGDCERGVFCNLIQFLEKSNCDSFKIACTDISYIDTLEMEIISKIKFGDIAYHRM